ncbi:hypothetical protein BDM02DRAFT_3121553 [Thelephora ganbajun]|uniref:Uncharacterized protein n=1 Tax=Thelephora ganbajun TaxID=370292 RepID=A0ACB6Z5S5_THEGA|nr:hypothetical protein BDM02DRAFT_3121553 [Thelephora ganbajun]
MCGHLAEATSPMELPPPWFKLRGMDEEQNERVNFIHLPPSFTSPTRVRAERMIP